MENVSYIEVCWTLFGILGIAVTAWGFRDAIRDLQCVHLLPDGEKKHALTITARGTLIHDAMRAVIMIMVTLIGYLTLTSPNAPPHPYRPSEVIAILAFLIIPFASMINAITERLVRRLAFPDVTKKDSEFLVGASFLAVAIALFIAGLVCVWFHW